MHLFLNQYIVSVWWHSLVKARNTPITNFFMIFFFWHSRDEPPPSSQPNVKVYGTAMSLSHNFVTFQSSFSWLNDRDSSCDFLYIFYKKFPKYCVHIRTLGAIWTAIQCRLILMFCSQFLSIFFIEYCHASWVMNLVLNYYNSHFKNFECKN